MTKQWTLIDMSRTRRRIVAPCPPGVPPGRVRFEWPDAVRRIWRRPERLSVSEWAERYRVMEPDGPRPGKWSNATARYLSGPMDAFSLPHVREAVVVAPPQTGKTESCSTAWALPLITTPARRSWCMTNVSWRSG